MSAVSGPRVKGDMSAWDQSRGSAGTGQPRGHFDQSRGYFDQSLGSAYARRPIDRGELEFAGEGDSKRIGGRRASQESRNRRPTRRGHPGLSLQRLDPRLLEAELRGTPPPDCWARTWGAGPSEVWASFTEKSWRICRERGCGAARARGVRGKATGAADTETGRTKAGMRAGCRTPPRTPPKPEG